MIRLVQEWPYATRQAAQMDIDDGTPGDGALRVPGTIGERRTSLRIDEGPTIAQYVSQEAWLLERLAKAHAALDEIAPTRRAGRDVWERIRDMPAEQEALERRNARAECGCAASHCPQHGAPEEPKPTGSAEMLASGMTEAECVRAIDAQDALEEERWATS